MKNIKTLILIVAITFSGSMFAQTDAIEPVFEKQGELIKGTFYYEDGNVRQEGTYKDGKLHGEWVTYNGEGKKNGLAHYTNGKKTGKWFFWDKDRLSEVNYEESVIISVNSWRNEKSIIEN